MKTESPIEYMFVYEFAKLLDERVNLESQVWCKANPFSFRVDFVARWGSKSIGIECDGRLFHRQSVDSRRDRAIVDSGCIRRIYRIQGCDIHHCLHDAISMIRSVDSWPFSYRGHKIIDALEARPGERQDDFVKSSFFTWDITRKIKFEAWSESDQDFVEREREIFVFLTA